MLVTCLLQFMFAVIGVQLFKVGTSPLYVSYDISKCTFGYCFRHHLLIWVLTRVHTSLNLDLELDCFLRLPFQAGGNCQKRQNALLLSPNAANLLNNSPWTTVVVCVCVCALLSSVTVDITVAIVLNTPTHIPRPHPFVFLVWTIASPDVTNQHPHAPTPSVCGFRFVVFFFFFVIFFGLECQQQQLPNHIIFYTCSHI